MTQFKSKEMAYKMLRLPYNNQRAIAKLDKISFDRKIPMTQMVLQAMEEKYSLDFII